jgi:hypothetical protein
VAGTADALVAWFEGWDRKRDGMWFFSDERRLVRGRIDAYAREPAPGRRVRQHIELNVDDSLLADAEGRDRYASLLLALCEAADAFVGWAAHTPVLRQRVVLGMRGRAEGRLPVPAASGGARDELEHVLPDVHWLDFLGPAFVDRWGSRLDQVGVRRRRAATGGVLLWATDAPFVLDESVDRVGGYSWKQPYYVAFGDAFVHEGGRFGQRGELVPTAEEHRAALARHP